MAGTREHGGEIVFYGRLRDLPNATGSLTADYLFRRKRVERRMLRSRCADRRHFAHRGVAEHNLKNIMSRSAEAPDCVTGSGLRQVHLCTMFCFRAAARQRQAYGNPVCIGLKARNSSIRCMVDQSRIAAPRARIRKLRRRVRLPSAIVRASARSTRTQVHRGHIHFNRGMADAQVAAAML